MGFAQHELPSCYLGSPQDDLEGLREVLPLTEHLKDQEARQQIEAELAELIATAEDWIAFNQLDLPEDWEQRRELWDQRKTG